MPHPFALLADGLPEPIAAQLTARRHALGRPIQRQPRQQSSQLTTSEDLPSAWLALLFNPGTVDKVWSELDALREAAAEEPSPSPHPRRLREYGRRRGA